jgi:hypothetical protein
MTKTKTRSFWFVASFFLLAALILSPVAIVSAHETTGDEDTKTEHQAKRFKHPRLGEVTEIDTANNTIVLKMTHPKRDDVEDRYVLVNYTDETVIMQDRNEATEEDIEIGEKVRVRGERSDSDEYHGQISAEKMHVFDELEPRSFLKHMKQKKRQK